MTEIRVIYVTSNTWPISQSCSLRRWRRIIDVACAHTCDVCEYTNVVFTRRERRGEGHSSGFIATYITYMCVYQLYVYKEFCSSFLHFTGVSLFCVSINKHHVESRFSSELQRDPHSRGAVA